VSSFDRGCGDARIRGGAGADIFGGMSTESGACGCVYLYVLRADACPCMQVWVGVHASERVCVCMFMCAHSMPVVRRGP